MTVDIMPIRLPTAFDADDNDRKNDDGDTDAEKDGDRDGEGVY